MKREGSVALCFGVAFMVIAFSTHALATDRKKVVALQSSVAGAPPQTTSAADCLSWFSQITGGVDKCLLDDLRDPSYFGVSPSDASDQQLLAYTKANEQAVATLLLQVDYGRDLQRFVTYQMLTLPTGNETAFLQALGGGGNIVQILGQVANTLNALNQTAASAADSESLSALQQILFGIQVYERFAQVLISSNQRQFLLLYFQDRMEGMSEGQAWSQLYSEFDGVLLQIGQAQGLSSDQLSNWFESSFVAYRLVGYSDSDSVRQAEGKAIALIAIGRIAPGSTNSQSASSATGEVVLADLLFSNDGKEMLLAPFLTYVGGQYTPLPDGIKVLQLSNEDVSTQAINPASPRVRAAIQESILNKIKNFEVYRRGRKVGSFSVTAITVTWAGGNIKVVGKGIPNGFQPQGDEMAIAGPSSHAGFWPPMALSSTQQKELLSQALGMIPKRVPAEWSGQSQGQPILAAVLVGKPIIIARTRVTAHVLDFKPGGKTNVFFNVSVEMKTSLGPFANANISLLDGYNERTSSWKRMLTCRSSWELQTAAGWNNGCWLLDVLDINGDGVAELVIRRGHGEGSNIEIYELKGKQLQLISIVKGWTGE